MATGEDRVALRRRRATVLPRGILFELDIETFPDSPEVCPCCGVRMERGDVNGGRRNAPTLERLIPERGYVLGNVIWVCWLCNTTKSNHSLAELYRVADFYWREHKQRGLPLPATRLKPGETDEDT